MTETTQLASSHGQLVEKNKVAVSKFLKEAVEKAGSNERFHGTFEQLETIAQANLNNWEPGVGSQDGDVRLINVPPEKFYTGITRITEKNAEHLTVIYDSRVEGEHKYPKLALKGLPYQPAKHVQIVAYRADLLAQDNNRSSTAEWEIASILANPHPNIPMHPSTMLRNTTHESGGTYREYTAAQWVEAVKFWQEHATIVP